MATSQMKPLPTAAPEPARAPEPAVVHSGEVLLLAAILGIGLLAWAGLALANAGRYSLPATVALAVAATVAVAVVAWRAPGRPRLVADRGGLAALAGVALVAAVLFFPGFAYGIGKDPGAYVSHAIAIARLGSSTLQDPVLDRSRVPHVEVTPEDPVGRFPAIWIKDRGAQRVVLQFYHLWPALLASAFKAGGYTGLVNLTPVCGVLAVLAVMLATRRVLGLLGGGLAGLLLAATSRVGRTRPAAPANPAFEPIDDDQAHRRGSPGAPDEASMLASQLAAEGQGMQALLATGGVQQEQLELVVAWAHERVWDHRREPRRVTVAGGECLGDAADHAVDRDHDGRPW
jgi:hypothetical protein